MSVSSINAACERTLASPPDRELWCWKEIAFYLGVSIRTAQYWERQRGLPVRRLPGGRGRVMARALELDRWKNSGALRTAGDPAAVSASRARPFAGPARRTLLVAALILAIAAAALLMRGLPRFPATGTNRTSVRNGPVSEQARHPQE